MNPESPNAHPELLLQICARRVLDTTMLRAEIDASPDFDWTVVLSMADYHRLTPIIAHHILASGVSVPANIEDLLRDGLAAYAMRNLELTARLQTIVAGLSNIGVQVIPYKGPSLALSAWGNLALRPFTDLDLLVREADLEHAARYLEANGYTGRYAFNARQNERFATLDGEYPYRHAGTDTLVELHTRISSKRFAIPLRTFDLFARSRSMTVAGQELRVLSAEDLVLVLCIHGSKHRWAALGWIADVAEVVRYDELDWEELLARARSLGMIRMLLVGLSLARDLLQADLPQRVLDMIAADRATQHLTAETVRHLRAMRFPHPVEVIAYNYAMLDRLSARVQFVRRWVFRATPEDYDFVSLPPSLTALYDLIRPFRLAVLYTFRSLRGRNGPR